MIGATVDLSNFRGRAVIVHFFATWCEPCRDELPALNRLSERAGGQPLAVVAISVAEADLAVKRFVSKSPLSFPVLLDRERTVARAWNVATLPTTFVLDADLRPRLIAETDLAGDTIGVDELLQDLATAGHADVRWKGGSTSFATIQQGG
jgi:thiol-disulfide isomerase/thioredoxin